MYRCAHCFTELLLVGDEVQRCPHHPYGNIEFVE